MFLEFQANLNGYGDIIALGAGDSAQTQLSQVPYALILDRVYVHGDPVLGQKRGIALQQPRHHDHQLVHLRLQSDRPGLAGDRRLQWPRQLPDREQLPRGSGRELPVRRRRSDDPESRDRRTSRSARNHLRSRSSWRDPIIATPASAVRRRRSPGGGIARGWHLLLQGRRTRVPPDRRTRPPPSRRPKSSATIAAGRPAA